MKSIKGRLLLVFFAIITTLSLSSIFFFVLNLQVIQQYKALSDSMIAEYRLVDTTANLITAYNTRAQSGGTDTTTSEKKILQAKTDIQNLTLFLDTHHVDDISYANYLGLKSSVTQLLAIIDASLKKDNVENYVSDYDKANKVYGFVRDNGTTLIFSELKYASSISKSIDQNYQISIVLGLSALIILGISCVVFGFRFAKRFTQPLSSLTMASKHLADGDMNIIIDQKLLQEPNEIGSLAQSFNVMTLVLREKMVQLDQAKKKAEENLHEVERMNALMMGRELRMYDLKKEIEELKTKQSTSINDQNIGNV